MNKHIRILIIFTILYLIVGLIYGAVVYAFSDALKPIEINDNLFLHLSTPIYSWPTNILKSSSLLAKYFDYSLNPKVTAIIVIGIIEVSLVAISRYINKKMK